MKSPAVLFAALAGLVLAAHAAQAEDPPKIDPAQAEACLAAAEGEAGRRACVGHAASVCMQTDMGQTTVGMVSCLISERDWWDARRDRALAAVLEKMRLSDEELAKIGSAAAPKEPLGTDAEAAWMVWKTAECTFEAAQWDGGSGAGPAAAACDMQITGERALFHETTLARE